MDQRIDISNKSTKDVIIEYLNRNRGREIAVSEISEKFNFSLTRISNAIKELEFLGEIIIERRKLSKGKYTVIRLEGDTITTFATHERELNPKTSLDEHESKATDIENFDVQEAIEILIAIDYTQSKFMNYLRTYYKSYFTLVTEIFQPVLYEIGIMWEHEEITVAEEHLMSARVEKLLVDLIKQEHKRTDKIILLSPVENEQHTLVLLAMELLLIEHGYNVINLSRSLSIISIIEFIKKMKKKPEWLFFSITVESYLNNLKQDIRLLRDEFKNNSLKIAVGGQGIANIDADNDLEVDWIVKSADELQELFTRM